MLSSSVLTTSAHEVDPQISDAHAHDHKHLQRVSWKLAAHDHSHLHVINLEADAELNEHTHARAHKRHPWEQPDPE
jgi:hypothetical protein